VAIQIVVHPKVRQSTRLTCRKTRRVGRKLTRLPTLPQPPSPVFLDTYVTGSGGFSLPRLGGRQFVCVGRPPHPPTYSSQVRNNTHEERDCQASSPNVHQIVIYSKIGKNEQQVNDLVVSLDPAILVE